MSKEPVASAASCPAFDRRLRDAVLECHVDKDDEALVASFRDHGEGPQGEQPRFHRLWQTAYS